MTKSYIDRTKDGSQQVDYQTITDLLNSLTPKEHGVLLDCILPQANKIKYPNGIAKPIAFLRAVNLPNRLMLIMVEYKIHLPKKAKEREIALKIDKSNFEAFREKDKLKFIFRDEQAIEIRLHNSFDFPYQLDSDLTIPTYPLIDWAKSPFI
ncbi:hypothetical protein Halha_2544 [Halobacteroides halobius DSM 5150]|uniref:Uncharacterized protein n=1 Tax=Halobacteroides halobius (strain ATCC 35273 / DSM 5150 / MD-1) TaxID=748449 RepID=L0KED1_HALHC|nr:hypothetical protein [Halobacteroides halobius]AGB42418.1 hypothetical protein Halha_2544 [Halobacteroides halobius DSM 5150]